MAQTLSEVGLRYGVVLNFEPELVRGRQAPALQGAPTLNEALLFVLGPSGLRAQRGEGGVVTILPPVAQTNPAAVASTPTDAEPRTVVLLDPVVVSAARDIPERGLVGADARSATRTQTALIDLPQAVSVLTRDSLTLQGEPTASEAMRYIAGTGQPGNTGGQRYLDAPVLVRGLPVQPMLSGMRTLHSMSSFESAFVERIEVVKGPNASVGGSVDVGGRGALVNLELKRPGTGSGNEQTTTVDTRDGGTVTSVTDLSSQPDAPVGWRLIALGRTTGKTEGGYDHSDATGLLGSAVWKLGRTELQVTALVDGRRDAPPAATYATDVFPEDALAPMPNAAIAPGSRGPVDPSEGRRAHTKLLDADWLIRLNDDWRLHLLGRSESLHSDTRQTLLRPQILTNRYLVQVRLLALQANLSGRIETGAVTHELLFAIDRDRAHEGLDKTIDYWSTCNCDPLSTPGDPRAERIGTDNLVLATRAKQDGLLVQDQLEWGPWRARVALRRGRYEAHTFLGDGSELAMLRVPPRTQGDAGLAWKATDELMLYGGVQRSLEATEPIGVDGETNSPIRTQQYQAGLKYALDARRALFTLEWFRLADLGDPTLHLGGRPANRSARGIELEYVGRVSADLQLSLALESIHYDGQRYDQGTQAELGTRTVLLGRAAGAPNRAGRLLAEYRLPAQWFASSRLGLGVFGQSRRVISLPDDTVSAASPLVLPGSARFDLSLTRDFGPHALTFAVRNVADRRLYGSYGDEIFLPLEPGRSFALTLRSTF